MMSSNQPLPFKFWTLEIRDQSNSELGDLQVIQQQFVFIRVHLWFIPHFRVAWTVRAERRKSACRLNSIHLRNLTHLATLFQLKGSGGS